MRQRDASERGSRCARRRAAALWLGLLVAAAGAVATGAGARLDVRAETAFGLPTPGAPALSTPTLPPVLPTVTPTLPATTPLPTPSLPVGTPLPTPSLPVNLTPTPTPSARPTSTAGGGGSGSGGGDGDQSGGTGGGGGGGGGSGDGITLPVLGVQVKSPVDAAILGAVAVLPLLFAVWVLLFGRTWAAAWRAREAQTRLALAHELGLRPREAASLSLKAMFKLREEAAFDEMTGALRRAAGVAALDREVARARRGRTPLAVAFVDVDGLKRANDRRGHKAGDELLRKMAATLKSGLRGQDLVMRYGGDEFVCVLPDAVADAARAKMSWIQTEAAKAGISFSSGVAQLERSDDVVSLLARADREMYAVKARHHKVRDLRLGVVGGSAQPAP